MVIFAVLTLTANLAGDEITPFFVWGMYSEKEKPVAHYDVLKVIINDSLTVDYSSGLDSKRFYLFSPLLYYRKIADNNGKDPTASFLEARLGNYYSSLVAPLAGRIFNTRAETDKFMEWYRRYMGEFVSPDIWKIRIDVVRTSYEDSRLRADSIYTWEIWKMH